MSLLDPTDLVSYGVSTGTLDSTALQNAINMAEYDIEAVLNTHLTPTQGTEEFIWSMIYKEQKVKLRWNYINSIDSTSAKHSLDADCVWVEDEACSVILDRIHSFINFQACWLSIGRCNCTGGIIPDRLVVTYTSGYTADEIDETTQLGQKLRMAIALQTTYYIQMLTTSLNIDGLWNLESFRSMDYSEKRSEGSFYKYNSLGNNPYSQKAYDILKTITSKKKVAIFLRGSGRY